MTYMPSAALIAYLASLGQGGQVYPMSTRYGYITASAPPENALGAGQFAGFRVSVAVPSGKAITNVGTFITTAGTLGTTGLNAFSVWSDDGTTMLGSTASTDSQWASTGVLTKPLQTPIAAFSTQTFVWVLANTGGYSVNPYFACTIAAGNDSNHGLLNPASGQMRTAYFNSMASWPASFNPNTQGTLTNYLPWVFLS